METSNVAHKINSQKRTNDVLLSENVDFAGLLLSDPIQKGLISAGFERPSPIQLKAIPLGRCGLDLIVQAKSGTGKTCVFSVVALESLQLKSSALQVLVLAPTREIAVQIQDVINSIGVYLPRLACHTFIGGLPVKDDIQKLKRCHIAIGSPGRVKQLIESGLMSTESIRLLVLDEADKLLEESFQDQINWIYSSLPENKQILALSATYPEYLANHLTAYMRNPTFIRLNISDPALLGIKQYYMQVPHHPLPNKDLETKTKAVVEILSSITFKQCLIFSNYQTRAQNLCSELQDQGWPTTCIAGSLDQKERLAAMNQLKTYQCRVLISTDLTSRGIDADKVDLVINLDVPYDHETYLHRIGRAGRYGSFGAAISIVSRGKEESELHAVEKKCNTNIWPVPEPLPVDLVKKDIPINIDDIISTEQIQTIRATAINGRSSHEKTEINECSKDIISNNSEKIDKLSCDDKNTNNSLITSSDPSVQDELFGKMDNLSDKDMKQSTQKFIYQEDKTEHPNLSLNLDCLKEDCSTSNSPVVDVRDITDSVVSFKKSPKARTVVVEESVKTNEKLFRNPSETRDLNNSHSLPLNITDSMNSINLKTKDSDELENVSFNLKTSALKTENCGSDINMNNSIISAKTNSKYSKKVNCLNVCTKSETPVSEDIICDLSDVTENFDNQSSSFKQPDKFNTNLLKVMEKTEVDSNHENQTDDKVVLQKCCQDVVEAVKNLNLENVMSVDLRNSQNKPSSDTMDAVEISSSAQSINPKVVSAKNETSNTKDITETKAGSDVKNKKLRNVSRYQEKLKSYDEFKNSETKCDYNYVARIRKDIQGSVKNIPSIETSRDGLARIDQIYSSIRQRNIGTVQTTSRETQTQDSATGDLRVPCVPSTNRKTEDNSKTMEENKMQLNALKINKMISPDLLESNLKDADDRLRNPSLQEFHPKLAKVCVSNQNGIASLSDVLDSSTPSKTSENIFQESDSEIAESSSSTSITSDSDSSLSSESEDERSCRKKDSDYFLTYKKSYGHQQRHRVTGNERGQFGARVDYRLPHNYFHANTWFYDQGYPYPYDDDRSMSKFTESSHNQRKNNAKKWCEPNNFESGSHRRDSGEMISERRKTEHRQAPLHKEKSKKSFIKSHQEDEDLSKQASRRPKKEKMEQPGKTKYPMFDSANCNNNYTESGYDYNCPRNKHGNLSYSSYPYYSMDPYYYKQSYDFYRNYPMNPYYREPYYNYYPNYPQPRRETIEESMKQMQKIAKIQRDYIRKMSRK